MLRDADTAMYRAKDSGKARHELFQSTMHARAVALLKLENDLRRAIERDEFCVYYQPIVSLDTESLAGFEALVRWHHPERGLVLPDEFVPVAEETGLIAEIGSVVLRRACAQMREWHSAVGRQSLTMSVNLSGKQLTQTDLISVIQKTLEETGLNPTCLRLEITESIVMENAELATNTLLQLRQLGVHLSIDDFGTGYSSLSYLHRFPVNTLKIDRSFIGRMAKGDENSEIVKTVCTLANNLGMEVVAEGVETREQMEVLRSLNCAYGQGYLFSSPVDAEKATVMVLEDHSLRGPLSFDPVVALDSATPFVN
jgi:EAL domain-containing protein (putative c-di-GMP-specific phosphodiesterase class I)